MKRYWVFSGDSYYPVGGMDDFQKDFDSKEEAAAHIIKLKKEYGTVDYWTQLYDTETMQKIELSAELN